MLQQTLPNQGDLLKEEQLLKRLGGVMTPKKFGELRRKRLIPVIKLGHRTLVYDEAAVRRAIGRLTVREVSS
jgi:hypothetical protein